VTRTLILLLLCSLGCWSGSNHHRHRARLLEQEGPTAALRYLEDKKAEVYAGDEELGLFDQALLYHYQGQVKKSNLVLDQLFQSLVRQVSEVPSAAEGAEGVLFAYRRLRLLVQRFFVHLVQTLNHLFAEDHTSLLLYNDLLAGTYRALTGARAGFLAPTQYLVGLSYERLQEPEQAYVCYLKTMEALLDPGGELATPALRTLVGGAALRIASERQFAEFEVLKQRWGFEDISTDRSPRAEGELLLLALSPRFPRTVQVRRALQATEASVLTHCHAPDRPTAEQSAGLGKCLTALAEGDRARLDQLAGQLLEPPGEEEPVPAHRLTLSLPMLELAQNEVPPLTVSLETRQKTTTVGLTPFLDFVSVLRRGLFRQRETILDFLLLRGIAEILAERYRGEDKAVPEFVEKILAEPLLENSFSPFLPARFQLAQLSLGGGKYVLQHNGKSLEVIIRPRQVSLVGMFSFFANGGKP